MHAHKAAVLSWGSVHHAFNQCLALQSHREDEADAGAARLAGLRISYLS